MLKKLAFTSALALLATVHPACADEETDMLRTQIKALEARLDTPEKKQAAAMQAVSTQKATLAATVESFQW